MKLVIDEADQIRALSEMMVVSYEDDHLSVIRYDCDQIREWSIIRVFKYEIGLIG